MITEADEYESQGAHKTNDLLESLKGFALYCPDKLTNLRHSTGAMAWQADTWRGRATRMRHTSGSSVISLRGVLDGSLDPFGDLHAGIAWLHAYGVVPGSPSSMAGQLWRQTLSADIDITFNPTIGRAALFGGRQEVREPRTYQHMVSADIEAAYPHAMASAPFALALREASPQTYLDPTVPGLATATVHVPNDLPYAPLPIRVASDIIQWQWGTVKGTWTWAELALAADLGCDVQVEKCYVPTRTADLFSPWFDIVMEGRSLPGNAARFAKMLANCLWGTFGMRGDDRALVGWTDDDGDESYTIKLDERKLPNAWTAHIAAECTSRLRVRLLAEGVYSNKRSTPVHMDTDGIIVRKSAPMPGTGASGPGCWRIKDRYKKVDIRAPQVYRSECYAACGTYHPKWHYVTAGVPASAAKEMFEREKLAGIRIGYRGMDIVLPPQHSSERQRNVDLVGQARSLVGSIYGRGLGTS